MLIELIVHLQGEHKFFSCTSEKVSGFCDFTGHNNPSPE